MTAFDDMWAALKTSTVWIAATLTLQPANSALPPNSNIASIDEEYTYLLPMPYQGNLTQDFISGTSLSNQTVASSLANARTAPFVSYTQEFTDLVSNSSLETIVANTTFPFAWAGEAGIWVPDLNQVWFTSTLYGGATKLYLLFLANNTVIEPQLKAVEGYGTRIPLANPAGGYYFDGLLYIAQTGNEYEPASLVNIDPQTYEVKTIVNSYFGLELPAIDDAVVIYTNTSNGPQRHIYFSTLDLAAFDLDIGRPSPALPNAFWKFSPDTKTLQPIITRSDAMTPNGVAVDRDYKHLFVTDTTATASVGGGSQWNVTGSPAIYRYDISPEDGTISNKVLFGITRQGVSDGMKVDDQGRVWTAEYEGVVVRNQLGKVIGLFNKEVILGTNNPRAEIANFAIAGDTLVILAVDHIQTVKLSETVIKPDRYYMPH